MPIVFYILLFLSLLMYIIVASISHLIIDSYKNDRFEKKIISLKDTFGKEIENQIINIFAEEDLNSISKLKNKLNKKVYERCFNEVIEELQKTGNYPKQINKFLLHFEDYLKKKTSQRLPRRATTTQALNIINLTHLLGIYRVDKFYINEFLISAVKSNIFYLKWTAFNSIVQIGNDTYLIEGLKYLSDELEDINYKLVIDMLDDYPGNMVAFNFSLLDYLDDMSSIAKRLIIAHYINSDFDLACDDLLQILKTTNDKELRLSILKYFQVFEFSDAMDILVNYMGNEEWEYRALAARALGNHESIESIGLLYDGLKDSNWHVRTNSARSLIKLVASSVLFNYIQDTDDKYARDTMIYALFESGKLTYDEFQYFIAEGVVLS